MKKLSRRDAILGGGAVWLLGRSAWAEPLPLDAVLADVAKARADLKTLTGPFTQTRTIGLLTAKVRSTGTLTLVRPDRLRWELAPPDDVTYWVGPEGLAYRSRTGQGRVQGANARVSAALDDLRVMLGGDLSRLRARYALSATDAPDGGVMFEATPLPGPEPPGVKKLVFTLAKDRVSPTSATLVEGARDRTEIVFGALVKNSPVDAAVVRPAF